MPPLGTDVLPRMRAIGAALPALELHVAAFQEIWDAQARAELIAAGHRAGLMHSWHRPRAAAGSGLLVLSRYPIQASRFEAFELGGLPEAIHHSDYWGGKGFVELTIDSDVGVPGDLSARPSNFHGFDRRGLSKAEVGAHVVA